MGGNEGEAGAGGKLKVGQSNHSDSRSTAVPSVWDLNWSNPQGVPRLTLGAAWYPMRSY